MDALPTIAFALAIGLIVVVSTMRSKRIPHDAGTPHRGGFEWNSGDSGGSAGDCGNGGAGCGDGGGGGN